MSELHGRGTDVISEFGSLASTSVDHHTQSITTSLKANRHARTEPASSRLMFRVGCKLMTSYQDALRILHTRRRIARPIQQNAQDPSLVVVTPDLKGSPSIDGMWEWLSALGHTTDDLKALNVIHVAGTKGKGSTCAFTESILRAHGMRTGFPTRTGLYTSPHLILPEERIRINFNPLPRVTFAKYFFEVYHALSGQPNQPRSLQMWAITAFHTFIREKVDVAIIETHHGGEFDATNFLENPLVTAITTLGMDHVQQLGPTLSNIAWHKAGIFKAGAVAVSAPQASEAAKVLVERAAEKGAELEFALPMPRSDGSAKLSADVLRTNCSVAVAASRAFLRRTSPNAELSEEDIEAGVNDFSWPGRFQQVRLDSLTWYLDAAHNEMSVEKAVQWFGESAGKQAKNILLFSHVSNNRDWEALLRKLLVKVKEGDIAFDAAVFTSYHRTAARHADTMPPDVDLLNLLARFKHVWGEYFPHAEVQSLETIDAAVEMVQSIAHGSACNVLVTGSQHLVGGVLMCIQPEVNRDHPGET